MAAIGPGDFEYDTNGGCWLWSKSTTAAGYGRVGLGRRGHTGYAHRASYECAFGPIPPDAVICHRCDTPACVNPDHLFVGSQGDNVRDAWRKGRMQIPPGKLSVAQVEAIKVAAGRGERTKDLAEQFGVSMPTISRIRHTPNQSLIRDLLQPISEDA